MYAALLFALAPIGEIHVDELHGFRIEVPDDWTTSEGGGGQDGFALNLLPPGSEGLTAVVVRVLETEGGGVERLVAESRERVTGDPEIYSDFEEWERELSGRTAPGVRATYTGPEGAFRIVQSFLVEEDFDYVLQRHAPADEFDDLADELEEVAATFGFVPLSEAARSERKLGELAALCGSEVHWAADWAEAEERARENGRLVLVVAWLLPGFSINTTPRSTLFMDEDLIELANARFVPLWYTPGMDAPFVDSYGMGPSTFGQALLLATPDGEVVLETSETGTPEVVWDFLTTGLDRNPEHRGNPVPTDLHGLERARLHVGRGELARAWMLLHSKDPSAAAHHLRARIHRLRREGAEALEALADARRAGFEPEDELLVEEAGLLVRERRYEEAQALLEGVIADGDGPEAIAEARVLRGMLHLRDSDREATKAAWRSVVESTPDSRWAWIAAAGLRSEGLDVEGLRPDYGWPDEAVMEELAAFPSSAVVEDLDRARRDALAWLLREQKEDGAWISPSELSTNVEGMGPDPFVDAIAALGGRALLLHPEEAAARPAARRALDFVLATIEHRRETPPLVFFMDYMTWSSAAMLHFLSDALEARLGTREELAPVADALLADLVERRQQNGGWSYYVTGTLGSTAQPQSISFTTAAAVLALTRARDVGFDVPPELVERGVRALEAMRGENGEFSYFLYGEDRNGAAGSIDLGAVGRGPACELALFSGGKSDPERLRLALDAFLADAPLYTAEQGKTLMHAGPQGQGCHYLFFDYAHAAYVHAALPAEGRSRVRLLDIVLDCRQPDGSFVDTPILGRAYGTAMALLALESLAGES